MAIVSLKISNFRNLVSVNANPISNGLNLIYGLNGSGKTSFLEAIYYLSLGRSFRAGLARHLINHSEDSFSLFAIKETFPHSQSLPIGLERFKNNELAIRIAGQAVDSITELAQISPAQIINSESYQLLDGGPLKRRKFIDWGVFYEKPYFLNIWRRYERALKQRNCALRSGYSKNELKAWSEELVETGDELHRLREEYVQDLIPYLSQMCHLLIDNFSCNIVYKKGWAKGESFKQSLQLNEEKDRTLGYTSVGPHRADLELTINNIAAKDILSRGQQKLFVCAMILAQGALLQDRSKTRLIYLVDDLPSELDPLNREKLVKLLLAQKAQLFVSAIEPETLSNFIKIAPVNMFHVKHGNITEEKLTFIKAE